MNEPQKHEAKRKNQAQETTYCRIPLVQVPLMTNCRGRKWTLVSWVGGGKGYAKSYRVMGNVLKVTHSDGYAMG
jgi:hypothetical protein